MCGFRVSVRPDRGGGCGRVGAGVEKGVEESESITLGGSPPRGRGLRRGIPVGTKDPGPGLPFPEESGADSRFNRDEGYVP